MDPNHHPKLNPVRAYKSLHDCNIIEAAVEDTSLSDLHDYEPSLEFDDTELQAAPGAGLAPLPPELLAFPDDVTLSSSDGTIEENFEKELGRHLETYPEIEEAEAITDEDYFGDLPLRGVVEVVGDDKLGRRVVTITACRLPSTTEVHPDVLLRYLICALDKYVEQDYIVIYYHYGLTTYNRPQWYWLWKAYKAFDRKFKKNMKAMYVVHPTNLIRIGLRFLRPVLSGKFFSRQKMMYINYLHQLREHVNLDTLDIPQPVLENDRQLLARDPAAAREAERLLHAAAGERSSNPLTQFAPRPRSQPAVLAKRQFGVSLTYIRDNNPDVIDSIPPIVRTCVEYLSKPDALETEGIFRRSTTVSNLRRMMEQCNNGEEVDFNNDPHQAAVLLKSFFRELDEPVLTHALFDEVMEFPTWPEKHRSVKLLLMDKLPAENYRLLKYVVKFLGKVADRSCMNKMTLSNLAVVFGPNFLWPTEGRLSLLCIEPVNLFTDYILNNQDEFFVM